jgi:threonine/homoserine/homoserine lactone efflux protein
MTAFLHGFLIGLSFVIFLGPVFFYLLKSSLEKGFWAGLFVALGIVIGDLICIIICSFGAIPFFKNTDNQFWLGVVGSTLLIGMGLKFLIRPDAKKAKDQQLPKKMSKATYLAYFSQGFLINFVNPFVFVVWIGIIGYAETEYGFSTSMFVFLAAALIGIFSTDMTKVYFAQKIKRFLTPIFLKRLYQFFGIALIVFGIRIIFYIFR